MSRISEGDKGGISINWTIENFIFIQNTWWTTFSLEWAKTNSKWKVEIKISSDETNTKQMRLVIEKLDKEKPSCLSGVISAIDHESVSDLQHFEDRNFLKTKEKLMWLTPSQGIDFEKKGFINNESLTLQIKLWDPSINEIIAAEHFIRSKYVEQKCSFQKEIKGDRDWKINRECIECSIEIPKEFIDYSVNSNIQKFRVTFSLQIRDEKMFAILRKNNAKSKSKSFCIRGSYKLNIQKKKGIEIFSDTKWNPFEFFDFKDYKKVITDELWDKPSAEWIVKIEMIIVTDYKSKIEKVCHEPRNQSQREKPKIAGKEGQVSNDSLQHSLHTLYKEGKFCDVKLRTGNKTFPCHRNVLGARSSVFRTMFEKKMLGTKISDVNIDEVDSRTLGMFLNYLYLDNLEEENFDSGVKLYEVAHKYAVLNLQKACGRVIVSSLSIDNVCEALELADNHKDDGLKSEIISFVCKHPKEIMNTTSWKRILINNPLLAAKTAMDVVMKQQ